MPFSLTNAPATFQSFIQEKLKHLLGISAAAYMDDILIHSADKESHIQHVQQVLQILHDSELYLKPEKCEFHVAETQYLSHIISAEGLKMDPSKIDAIWSWPTLKSTKDVHCFFGTVQYY
jgi:hypothetical protein